MKGEGDGERNKIFANAFGRDPQFFAFYRAMQAYEKALIGGETSLVLSPDSEFFKFFGKSIKPALKNKHKYNREGVYYCSWSNLFCRGTAFSHFPVKNQKYIRFNQKHT